MDEKKQYYQNRKEELNKSYQQIIFEAYDDIQRTIIKALNKQRELQAKLQELEAQEKGNKPTQTTNPHPKTPIKPVK